PRRPRWHGSPAGTTPRSVPPSHRYPYRRTARWSMRWFAPSLCCPLLRSGASIVLRTVSPYTKSTPHRQTVNDQVFSPPCQAETTRSVPTESPVRQDGGPDVTENDRQTRTHLEG